MLANRTFNALAYIALSTVIGTIAFISVLVTVVIGVPLLVVALAGLPLLLLAFAMCHGLALTERHRAAALMGAEFPVRTLPTDRGQLGRLLAWMRSRGAWLELCYALVGLPIVAWLGGALVFTVLGGGLAFVAFPVWGWAAAGEGDLLGWSLGYLASSVLHVGIGVAALLASPWRPAAWPTCRSRWRACCS